MTKVKLVFKVCKHEFLDRICQYQISAMLRGTQLPPVDQMELFREAIISIENEIRLNENIDATYRPKIKEGHLIYDEKVHERTDMEIQ